MLAAQCHGYKIMKPSVFTLVNYKPCCHYTVLPATKQSHMEKLVNW